MEPKKHADLAQNTKKLQTQKRSDQQMRQLDDATLKACNDFVESGVKQHVDPSVEVDFIFELLRVCGGESAVPPRGGTGQRCDKEPTHTGDAGAALEDAHDRLMNIQKSND